MLRNESVNGWLELVKTNSANAMQTLAEKRLNPNNCHLSPTAKKRLRWLYLLYYEEKGNVSKAARKAGLSRQWLSCLRQAFERNSRNPLSLEPRSKAPKDTSCRKRIPLETEALIIAVRDYSKNCWGKTKTAAFLENELGIKVNDNTVNKYLHKHERINPELSLKNTEAFQEKKLRESENILLKVKFRPPTAIKDYASGALIEKDMKYVAKYKQEYEEKNKENFWYQFSEIDSFTRIKTLEVSDQQGPKTAAAPHAEAKKRFPFKIACENTDSGFENNNDFLKELDKEMVFHFYSNVGTPTDNPRVERSHLTDDIEFYERGGICNDLQEQKEKVKEWEYFHNFERPHQALGYLTPMQFYRLWRKSPKKAHAVVARWQQYLQEQRIRLARSRRIKKKEQIEVLMKFIDAKLNRKKGEVQEAKLQLINCQLCSVA